MNRAETLTVTAWRTSSYSTNGGNCVEIGEGITHAVPVRDSKNPMGPALVFSGDQWDGFMIALKGGALFTQGRGPLT
ncbi:DUF397 domain-containing protein [Streptomyces radicis]|uniref:DUF397 domain-containing protein n=1 Tax=Streptomyces radicis TaxID=1750517 RepID=A0A3A9W0B3_9ACTN|nr:DUF397 domain-containing protein [Streptomyces radicis]RKN06309.1 DUF397 domain-containing protein [Streptomyces radicis]RKN18639.1 DUF397 domain-containing protein [Streptomyces radicis]